MVEERSKTTSRRLLAFLKSHPVVCLLLLTPGIPEYLSSSSPINAIVLNPPQFLFQILANLGLYGSGALLIHDARVRWNKGWVTVLLLGAAYGILEEGVALSTLFNPNADPVGSLGAYGHWLGVNWVWSAGIVPFHALWSIALPILLLGLALPETADRNLLSRRGTVAAFGILVIDVLLLMIIVYHASGYWMGGQILLLSLISIGGLVWAARRVSAGALAVDYGAQGPSERRLTILGISFFPVVLLSQGLGQGSGLPAVVDFVLVILVQALYLRYVTRRNWRDRKRGMVALALGLIIPIAVFGVLAELALPMTLFADVALVLFFRRLSAKYTPSDVRIIQTVN
jgi:hypothetical protein